IEYLSLGVHAAAVGFDNVDDETRRRFHEIQTRIDTERKNAAKPETENDRGQSDLGWESK
ncbi:hypothetical protein DDE05_20055, partial [Streptomyces cavourensis]